MRVIHTLIISAAVLAGCAGPIKLVKPGGTQQEFARDHSRCMAQATTAVPGGGEGMTAIYAAAQRREQYEYCMQGEGWTRQ